ncbi:MAG: transposase, partial [Planctomycetes bacterium]|nr:transposase [Planctomycetota bacterium]
MLAFRELDEAFRLTEQGSTVLSDPRQGRNTQHTMLAMLRQGDYGRGTAVQWTKEGKYSVKWTRLSCRHFKDNQARLQPFALAYNLGNFLRRVALPRSVMHGLLTTLREKLIKIEVNVVRHAKYVTFQMAEVAMPGELFAAILERIQR